LKHPLLIGLSFGVGMALLGLFAYRHFEPAGDARQAVHGVDLQAVWSASLPDMAGRSQALAQWQGRVLVVNFWAPWCPPCRAEIPGFMRLQARHGAAGLQFVGIALDDPDKVRAYVAEAGITYPILLGGPDAAQLARAAGNRLGGLPYSVVFDRQGNPVAAHTGGLDEDRVERLIEPLL
jgi:thiol-disulfide isomerase/thioredoxin